MKMNPTIILVLFCLGFCPLANADTPIITNFTGGGGPFASFYGDTVLPSGDAIGYRFTADADIFVTALGILDDPSDGVLDSAHTVALWRDSDMALMASASVSSADNLMGGFYYASIGPIQLDSGSGYTLAALYAVDDGDTYLSGPSSVTTDGISNLIAVFPDSSNLGLTYPGLESAGNLARIGPNALFTAIPEPTSFVLCSLCGIVLFGKRRRP